MGNYELTLLQKTKMKDYLSSPNIDAYITQMLGERKSSFITTVATMAGPGSKLQNCDKQSVMMAALKAVGMNLPIDQNLGFAWIIDYGGQAQFQIGAKGFLQLALRTGNYKTINAIEVVDGEFKGRDWIGEPIIQFSSEEDRLVKPIIGYAAGYETLSGTRKIVYWTVDTVKKHAERFSQGYRSFLEKGPSQSKAKSGNLSNPWATDFNAMGKKSVTKNLLSQYGELTTEVRQAIRYDQAVISLDDKMNETVLYLDNPESIESYPSLSKKNQELLLKSYDAGLIKEALHNVGIEDITQLEDSGMNDFITVCEKLKNENAKLSGDKPSEDKQIKL